MLLVKYKQTYKQAITKSSPVPIYTEDQEQIEAIHSYLISILDSTITVTRSNSLRMSFFQR